MGRRSGQQRREQRQHRRRREDGAGRRERQERRRRDLAGRREQQPREEPRLLEALAETGLETRERLEPEELAEVLSCGAWGRLGPETVAILAAMRAGRRQEAEPIHRGLLGHIWRRLERWDAAYAGRDETDSGRLPRGELAGALAGLGYRLSADVLDLLLEEVVGLAPPGHNPDQDFVSLEEFIQVAGLLEAVTGSFKQRDVSRRGEVLYSYHLFLQDALRLILRLQLYR